MFLCRCVSESPFMLVGSLISSSTSQSPPSKSASDSVIFSFFKLIDLLKKLQPRCVVDKFALPVISLHFPTCLMWMKKERVSFRACTYEWSRSHIPLLYNSGMLALTWLAFCGGTVVKTQLLMCEKSFCWCWAISGATNTRDKGEVEQFQALQLQKG